MNLGSYLPTLTKPEIEEITEEINLADEEKEIFIMLSRKKTAIEIAQSIGMSERTVYRRIREIKHKIEKVRCLHE